MYKLFFDRDGLYVRDRSGYITSELGLFIELVYFRGKITILLYFLETECERDRTGVAEKVIAGERYS